MILFSSFPTLCVRSRVELPLSGIVRPIKLPIFHGHSHDNACGLDTVRLDIVMLTFDGSKVIELREAPLTEHDTMSSVGHLYTMLMSPSVSREIRGLSPRTRMMVSLRPGIIRESQDSTDAHIFYLIVEIDTGGSIICRAMSVSNITKPYGYDVRKFKDHVVSLKQL